MNDPRVILMSNIESVSSLPSGLVDALYAGQDNTKNRKNVPSEKELFMKATLDNPHANLAERHRMAQALLDGKPVPICHSGEVIHHHHKKLKSKSDVSLRHTAKNNFLQLKSEAVPIKALNVTQEMKKYKSKRELSVAGGFTWGNDYISPTPEVYNVKNITELNKRELHLQKIASVSRAQLESKKNAISRNIEEVKNVRIESMKQKDYIKDINTKKLEDKKKIAELRQQILDRLKEKHDTMLGPIMRCIDDALLFHFMDQFKGYAMSVDAVIALIGKSLGSDNTILKPKEATPDNVELSVERQPFVTDGYGLRSPQYMANANRPVSPHRETMVPSGSGSAPKGLRDENGNIVEGSVGDSLTGWSFGGATGTGTGTATGLEFPPVSRGKTQEWGRNNPQTKSFGSGFRTHTGSPIRDYGRNVEKQDRRPPMRLVATNSTSDEMIAQEGDPFRYSRKKMYLENAEENLKNDSIYSTCDAHASRAIGAMRGQLVEEDRLPSQQPIKMFTDAELTRIGSAPYKKSEITEMLLNRKLAKKVDYRVNQMAEENAGIVGSSQFSTSNILNEEIPGRKPISPLIDSNQNNINNTVASGSVGASVGGGSPGSGGIPKSVDMRVTDASEIMAPRSIKSSYTNKPTYLYNTSAERAAFLAGNVAGGAGLSLWGDKRKLHIHNLSSSLTSSSKLNKGTTIASPAVLNMKTRHSGHNHQMFT